MTRRRRIFPRVDDQIDRFDPATPDRGASMPTSTELRIALLRLLGTLPGGSGGVTDGDKGDVTVSAGGTVWTIDNDVVTYAKMQNVSATDRLLGRVTAGPGDVEEITCTAAGRALLDDANAAAQRTTLGLVIGSNVLAQYAEADNLFGSLLPGGTAGVFWTDGLGAMQIVDLGAASAGDVLSWDGSSLKWIAPGGISDGDKGDVTVSVGGTVWTIDDDVVTFAKMQNSSAASVLVGRRSGSSGDFEQIELGAGLSMTGAILDTVDAAPALSYSPGSFTLATEEFAIRSRHLKLTTTQRVTLEGTATLRIT